ncbi:MAG: hypothetical protein K5873_04145 [Treponema sp.]|nr:hypothetical protein [Treponema sp.]
MKKTFIFSFILFFLFLGLSSCGSLENLTCPYVISNARVELCDYESEKCFTRMNFSLLNDSSKDIEEFTLSFMLYDSEGKNPFITSNNFVSKCKWNVKAGENLDFTISLDPYISLLPQEPFLLDYLYVRSISYSDGSKWNDPYGMYCMREEIE